MKTQMAEITQRNSFRYGMVGGGEGSFIGDVHRKAIALAGNAGLVSGCFDIETDNNIRSGLKYGVSQDRIYQDYREMAAVEAARPDRADFVVIVTPNHLHYSIAKAFLEQGFHVVCEKPLCFETKEAIELEKIASEKNLMFGLAYTYIGYPMVKQARQLVRAGVIGEVVEVVAEFAQSWLAGICLKQKGNITTWRNDPAMMGRSGCVGDIGTHIDAAVSYITGLKTKAVCANLRAVGAGVNLDSIGEILIQYENGASGIYWCSQMAHGCSNGLKIRIYGDKGSVEWEQENPCVLKMAVEGSPTVTMVQGKEYLYPEVRRFSRLPAGHPEGFYEAFANLYVAFMDSLSLHNQGILTECNKLEYVDVYEGIRRVEFVNMCVSSSQGERKWVYSR